VPLEDIEEIELNVPEGYDSHVGSEHKYDPKDRKTADHSLPYMVARALVDGEITLDTATDEKVLDPTIRPLMRKIKVIGTREMSDIGRNRDPEQGQQLAISARIRAKDGREIGERLPDHSGSASRNPGRDFYDKKFNIVTRGISPEKREEIRSTWWDIEKVTDIGEPIKTLGGIRQL
jgi:2-methylcitrate dehydratase